MKAEWAIITALALFTAYYRQWQEMTGRTKRRLVRKIKGLFA